MLKTMVSPMAEFEDAVRKHRPALVTFAYRALHDAHEAEDTTQAALARAVQAIRSGDVPSHPRPWLYKFVLREVQHCLEKRRVRSLALESRAISPPDPASAESSQETLALRRRTLEEVDRLEEPYRAILLLRFCQHLSYEEVSAALEMPTGTVKSYQSRALRQLRERLSSVLRPEV